MGTLRFSRNVVSVAVHPRTQWTDFSFIAKKVAWANSMGSSRAASTATSDSSEVLFEKSNCTGLIQLNKPKTLNSLTLDMIRLMYDKIEQWKKEGVKLIVCKGGEKAFCAGGDVVSIYHASKIPGNTLGRDFFREEYILDHQIGSLQIPYVALIHGITMGGGVGISVHGRYRVATEKTMFAMPETAIGFLVDVGGSFFLPRLKGKLGTYLALTGNRLVGKDVKHAGIATHFVDAALMSQLEKDLVSLKEPTNAGVEKVLDQYEQQSTVQKDHEFSLAKQLEVIDRNFGESSVEKIFSSLAKDNSDWSKKMLDTMSKMSPSSLKIALRQMQLGGTKNLAECLKMEFRAGQRIGAANDFHEGVRAKLVDKDNQPRWKPSKLEEISDADIDAYFAPFTDPKAELQL